MTTRQSAWTARRDAHAKIPLPLFKMELEHRKNREIYKIKTLLNVGVKFEPPHKKLSVPQRTRQNYGLTKSYYGEMQPRFKYTG